MPSYRFVVFTNCREGTDSAFNRWYDEQHAPDVLAVPGFVGITRGLAVPQNGEPPTHRYMAIYEIESDDVDAVLAELMRRSGTELMPISDTLLPDARTTLWQVTLRS
jgi:hypothetical protein